MIRAGLLKYRITLLRRTMTINALKERIETLVKYRDVKADMVYMSGSEAVQNYQETAINTRVFTLRFDENITEHMVIRHDGVDYNIRYIEHIRRSATKLTASKIN